MEMPHKLVLVEGRQYPGPLRVVEKGAIVLEDEEIPVTRAFDLEHIVGKARNFTRDSETGECYIDISILDKEFSEVFNECDVNVFLTNITMKNNGSIVTYGRLRSVAFCAPVEGGWHKDEAEGKKTNELLDELSTAWKERINGAEGTPETSP